jgi:hypothetical protein
MSEKQGTGKEKISIGCFSGFWGDSKTGAAQLVRKGNIDFLVGDYLAEVTMGILARLQNQGSQGIGTGGHITEFAKVVWEPLLKEIVAKKIRVITNAGGMSPNALKKQLEAIAQKQGIQVQIASVEGDNLTDKYQDLLKNKSILPFSAVESDVEPLPNDKVKVLSLNTYLGAFPIAHALDNGAQVVVTGRIVDSALVLGPLIHAFKWSPTDYDLLAKGSIIGHIIECGCHATGGNFTDWEESYAQGWHDVGFPIAECFADGTGIITKPPNTGGLVSKATVAEQLVYEILDPAAYYLPDVIADFRSVILEEEIVDRAGKDQRAVPGRVRVSGGRGKPPTQYYKASITAVSGFKSEGMIIIGGPNARRKAIATAESVIKKCENIFAEKKLGPFTEYNIEALGSEHYYGANARCLDNREIILRITVTHSKKDALEVFAGELIPSALSMAPGISGSATGRPQPRPNLYHYACLIDKDLVSIKVYMGNEEIPYSLKLEGNSVHHNDVSKEQSSAIQKSTISPTESVTIPLIKICHGRSGDKGDVANIGIICRDKKYFPIVKEQLTSKVVKEYMAHLVKGGVTRYELPGISAFNFVCTQALGGGGLSSLNYDRQGKCYAQVLLDIPIQVPKSLIQISKL